MRWRKVTLIGVGLLGGSLGLALKRRGLADRVHGYVRREASISECRAAGVVDEAGTDLALAVQGADLVVFCTPLAQMASLAQQMKGALAAGGIITDVGSVKAPVVEAMEPIAKEAGAFFVGSHPMAGSEKVGVGAAKADLFENAVCVLTPTAGSSPQALGKIHELWESVGGRVMEMSPQTHDQLVSRSSHLPHVVAAQLASYVLGSGAPIEQQKLCANGFRDTTRVASGSPEMWRDIVLANRGHLAEAMDDFLGTLQTFKKLLEENNATAIEEFFREAKLRRDQWASHCTTPSPE